MSVAGHSYGQDDRLCDDAYDKDVTNFNMVDSDINKLLKSVSVKGSTNEYEQLQRFLSHLALCHTVSNGCKIQDESSETCESANLSSPSPDELALLNAAKYYGIKFVKRT